MNRAEALRTLCVDYSREAGSPALFKRAVRSLKKLGFVGEELSEAGWYLMLCDTNGKPFDWTGETRNITEL